MPLSGAPWISMLPIGSPSDWWTISIMWAPMRLSTLRMAVRVGLRPTSLMSRREPGRAAAATSQKAALEMSPGTVKSQACGDLAAVDGDGVALVAGADAERREHALGVVAGFGGLDDGGFAFGEQAGEQHGAFHLGAGHRHFVGDRRGVWRGG